MVSPDVGSKGTAAAPMVKWEGGTLKLKVFYLSEVQMRPKFIHFCYSINCSNTLLKEYCCVLVWSYFIGRYQVAKMGLSSKLLLSQKDTAA